MNDNSIEGMRAMVVRIHARLRRRREAEAAAHRDVDRLSSELRALQHGIEHREKRDRPKGRRRKSAS